MNLLELTALLKARPLNRISCYENDQIRSRSFDELHADVQLYVAALRRVGIETGHRVGILASNCYAYVVVDLALIELRCQSVCFPESFAACDPRALCEEYDLALLFVDDGTHSTASWIIELGAIGSTSLAKRPDARAAATDPQLHEFTLIFSSGTSGRVRCMKASRGGVERMLERLAEHFPTTPSDALLVFLPLSNFQQRMMVYAAIHYPYDVALVKPTQLMRGFTDFRPTTFIAPPIFFESIHRRFAAQPAPLRKALEIASRCVESLPLGVAQRSLRKLLFLPLHRALGGRVRLLLTGMAPTRKETLSFFIRAGLPTYEAYSVTECGMIAINTPRSSLIGSVGQPFEQNELRLAADGQVLVKKSHPLTTGYLRTEDGAGVYLEGGWIATGDIARIDASGFMHLLGRRNDIIVSSSGEKIHPELIENTLDALEHVVKAVVFGRPQGGLVVVVFYSAPPRPDVELQLRRQFEVLNRGASHDRRIAAIVMTTESYSPGGEFMTPNLKLRRDAVYRRFIATAVAQDGATRQDTL